MAVNNPLSLDTTERYLTSHAASHVWNPSNLECFWRGPWAHKLQKKMIGDRADLALISDFYLTTRLRYPETLEDDSDEEDGGDARQVEIKELYMARGASLLPKGPPRIIIPEVPVEKDDMRADNGSQSRAIPRPAIQVHEHSVEAPNGPDPMDCLNTSTGSNERVIVEPQGTSDRSMSSGEVSYSEFDPIKHGGKTSSPKDASFGDANTSNSSGGTVSSGRSYRSPDFTTFKFTAVDLERTSARYKAFAGLKIMGVKIASLMELKRAPSRRYKGEGPLLEDALADKFDLARVQMKKQCKYAFLRYEETKVIVGILAAEDDDDDYTEDPHEEWSQLKWKGPFTLTERKSDEELQGLLAVLKASEPEVALEEIASDSDNGMDEDSDEDDEDEDN